MLSSTIFLSLVALASASPARNHAHYAHAHARGLDVNAVTGEAGHVVAGVEGVAGAAVDETVGVLGHVGIHHDARDLNADALLGEAGGLVAGVPHVVEAGAGEAVGALAHVGVGHEKRADILDLDVGACAAVGVDIGGSLLDTLGLGALDVGACVCAEAEVVLGTKTKKYVQPPSLSCGTNEKPSCELKPVCACKEGYEMKDGVCKPTNCPADAKVDCTGDKCTCDCGGFDCDPLISVDTCVFVQAAVAADLCKIDVDAELEICVCASVDVGLGSLMKYNAPKLPTCSGHGKATCSTSPTCTCDAGYIASGDKCIPGPSSTPKARRDGALATRRTCPNANEEACPIFGSKRDSGFECLDTTSAVESCGGCASTQQGTNCLDLPGALGVGCSAGKCEVLSCKDGFKLVANSCVAV